LSASRSSQLAEPIYQAGGIDACLSLCRKGGEEEANNSAGVLALLARNKTLIPVIVKRGGLQPIVKLLQSKPSEEVVGAVMNLATDQAVAEEIVGAGGVAHLTNLLRAQPDLPTYAAAALRNLAGKGVVCARKVSEDATRALIDMLREGSPPVKEQVAGAIKNLLLTYKESKAALEAAGAAEGLDALAKGRNGATENTRKLAATAFDLLTTKVEKSVMHTR